MTIRTRLNLVFFAVALTIFGTLLGIFFLHVQGGTVHELVTSMEPVVARQTPEQEMDALAAASTVIGDGFSIQNFSQFNLKEVAFACNVDNHEQVFEWNEPNLERTDEYIAAGTSRDPESLFYIQLTAAQYKDGGVFEHPTAVNANLSQDEIAWLLRHHKVTGCYVFSAEIE
jgi:hypothetical protein